MSKIRMQQAIIFDMIALELKKFFGRDSKYGIEAILKLEDIEKKFYVDTIIENPFEEGIVRE